jgi:hypothetical protein
MLKCAGGLSFLVEARPLLDRCHVVLEHLDSNGAIQKNLPSLVNYTHATGAKHFEKLVLAQIDCAKQFILVLR